MPRDRPVSLRSRALGLLARREHSRHELEVKLAPLADTAELTRLLDGLEADGWLSDARVVEQAVEGRRRLGSRRIVGDLRRKGVAQDLIDAALPKIRQHELASARDVWRRKFGRRFGGPPPDAAERARQMRFLLARGFSMDVAARVLRGEDE